jgi:hypothetical protein
MGQQPADPQCDRPERTDDTDKPQAETTTFRSDRFTWDAPVAILYDPLRDGPKRPQPDHRDEPGTRQ